MTPMRRDDDDLIRELVSVTHQQASGLTLPRETAEPFGLALLCALQDHCRQYSQSADVAVQLCRVEDSEDLYLSAGDATRETLTTMPVPYLIRALLLREPEAPQMGFRVAWQVLPQGLSALEYRAHLRRSPWRRDLDAYVVFLALTHRYIRAGQSAHHAQRAAAHFLARTLKIDIMTEGYLHTSVPPATQNLPQN